MKRKITHLFIGLFIILFSKVNGQGVGINATGANPDASAKLDIVSTTKGFLIPRVALTATNAVGPITTPATSLLVYNTATASSGATVVTPGFYYWDGSKWVRFQDVVATDDWHLLGNSGTVDGTNFVGTTDNIAFNFKVNNQRSGRIGIAADGSTFLGYQAGLNDDLANRQNTFVGYQSGYRGKDSCNTALGYQAFFNDSATCITAIGAYAARNYNNHDWEIPESVAFGDSTLTSRLDNGNYWSSYNWNSCAYGWGSLANYYIGGSTNAAFGYKTINSVDQNSNASYNAAFGYSALRISEASLGKVAIGPFALDSSFSHNNVAIGDHAQAYAGYGNNVTIGDHAFSKYDFSSAVAIGNKVLQHYDTYNGGENTVLGNNCFFSFTSSWQTAIGHNAYYSAQNSAGDALGYNAGLNLVDADATAIGYNSMVGQPTAYPWLSTAYTTAFGDSTLFSIISGETDPENSRYNTAQGHKALFKNTGGKFNTAFGSNALMEITSGYSNIAFGYNAGRFITNGTSANDNSTVSMYIGSRTKASTNTVNNEVVIGYNTIGNGAHSVTIGNGSIATTALKGKVGVGVRLPLHDVSIPDITTPTAQFDIQNNAGTGYNQLRLETSYTPSGTSDTNGNVGDIAWNANYLYIKTAGGWKRRALSTW